MRHDVSTADATVSQDAQRWPLGDGVMRIASARLICDTASWAYAEAHRSQIEECWQRAKQASPHFFNGTIHLVRKISLNGSHLDMRLLATEFKAFVYWREQGFPAAGVLDAFGSALIRARGGEIILGRQVAGNINGGLAYTPSGFIDDRDVAGDGTIDISASIAREVAEETGLSVGRELTAEPGFYLTRLGAQLSIARPLRSELTADDIVERVRAHISADANPELSDVVVVSSHRDIEGLAMPPYARLLVPQALGDAPVA